MYLSLLLAAAMFAGEDVPPDVEKTPQPQAAPAGAVGSLPEATKEVLRAITEAAAENRRRPAPTGQAHDDAQRLSGDRLTEHLFRRAAAAAASLPNEVAADAFLLGIGIGLDDSEVLRRVPLLSRTVIQAEPDEHRKRRLAVLGKPTMRGRRDLTQHFVVSCALVVLTVPQAAEGLGLAKEISDAKGGSGFSFVDLLADLAGIELANRVRDGKPPLAELARSFAVDDFLPSGAGLREGVTWKAFESEFGSLSDPRFLRQRTIIRERILQSPGYRGGVHPP
ncbi:MAG: hypothetical protein ACYTG0_35345 [Planctomycetota bacterium]|jgi:hypothetical protein